MKVSILESYRYGGENSTERLARVWDKDIDENYAID
tara:strand:- start:279 stop:386 length:108 start_codon:yes stop_codon:yes gene_type:complete